MGEGSTQPSQELAQETREVTPLVLVIAIDFDGTASDHPEAVNLLYEDPQNLIVIYTARSEMIRGETVEELRRLGIRYHALVMGKFRADIYVDDKNEGGLKWPK